MTERENAAIYESQKINKPWLTDLYPQLRCVKYSLLKAISLQFSPQFIFWNLQNLTCHRRLSQLQASRIRSTGSINNFWNLMRVVDEALQDLEHQRYHRESVLEVPGVYQLADCIQLLCIDHYWMKTTYPQRHRQNQPKHQDHGKYLFALLRWGQFKQELG